ncbi:glycosyltransferase family 39 protein [Streptomyces sp. NPDC046751]|uniref:glycosyltransferase family 39 protein n=1 Tax=Streptomyces sp. NPDC046751 TaxID=3160977 RepID=UPI0033D13629
MLAWAAIALVVVRIGRTGDTRWWLAVGALVGVGAEFNHLAAIFGAVPLAATLLGPARRTVADRPLLVGAAIAVPLVLPDLWWQARHGWAVFEMTRALNGEHGGPGNILTWITGQFGLACLAMTVLWVAGPRFLWRSGRPMWRCLVIAYSVLFVLFAVTTGAQVYYLGGPYVCLLAAGGVGLDGWLRARPDRLRGVGPRQPARHDRGGRRAGPRAHPRARRPAASLLPARPRGRHPLQPAGRAQHRMGRPGLRLYRPPPVLGHDLARTADVRLTPRGRAARPSPDGLSFLSAGVAEA